MISIRIQGRLGNQLFQYAFVLVASKKLNTDFYIDQYNEHLLADKYFKNLKGNSIFTSLFQIKGFKNLFNYHLRRVCYKYLVIINKFLSIVYDYDVLPINVKLQNNTLYEGYFQSEQFFIFHETIVRKAFKLKVKFINQFKHKNAVLYNNNCIVTVHIRRTDYQNLQHLNLGADDLTLPIEYYKKAIAQFEGQAVHFVFISDDVNFVNKNFKEIANKTISTDIEIIDFQHLLNADHCVISNSTFSWWGAWLNNKPNKIIYAPEYFLGWRIKKETPVGIYPKGWIQISF